MADKKISQLTVASSLTGTEIVPVVQSGTTKQTTVQDIANLGGGAVDSVNSQTGVVVLASTDIESSGTPTNYTPDSSSIEGHLIGIDDALGTVLGGSVVSVNGESGVVVLDNSDIGLGNVTNDAQLTRAAGDFVSFTAKTPVSSNDILLIEDSEDTNNKKNTTIGDIENLIVDNLTTFANTLYVDYIDGDDTLGTGSLNSPYQTVEYALSLVPDNLPSSSRWAIILSAGEHIASNILLKPHISLIGTSKQSTRLVCDSIGLDLSNGNFEDVVSVEICDMILDIDTSLGCDTSTLSSANYLELTLRNLKIYGDVVFVGKAAGNDSLLADSCIMSNVTTTRILGTIVNCEISNLLLQCSGYSGGGPAPFYIRNSAIQGIVGTTDNSKQQQLYLNNNLINSLSVDSTAGTVHSDVVSLPQSEGSVSLTSGCTLNLLSSSRSILAEYMPANYSPADVDLRSHLSSIDDKLGNTSNRLAVFDSSGLLDIKETLQLNSLDGMTLFHNEQDKTNPVSPTYRNIHEMMLNMDMSENIADEWTNLLRFNVQVDPNNDGYDYAGTSGGVGLISSYIGHRGAGHLGRLDVFNTFIELGDENTPIAGTSGWISAATTSIVVRPQFEVQDLIRNSFIGLEVRSDAIVQGYIGLELNCQLQADAQMQQYCQGLRSTIGLGDNASVDGGECLSAYISVNTGAVSTSFLNGASIGISNNGLLDGCQGLSIYFNGTGTYTNSPTGISIDMGSFDTTVQRRAALAANNGSLSLFQTVSTVSNMFFDQGNIIVNQFHVTPGNPITMTAFIGNNMSTLFMFEDDMDAGILGLGATSLISGGQIAVASGKTASLVNLYAGGMTIPDLPGLGGTAEKINVFNALGVLPSGGPDNVVIDEVRGFTMPDGCLGNAIWGIDISNTSAENHLAKSLIIGTANVVSNNDIALELGDKKALKLTPMTIAERDALTALPFMLVAIDDGITKELQFYDGSTWVSL